MGFVTLYPSNRATLKQWVSPRHFLPFRTNGTGLGFSRVDVRRNLVTVLVWVLAECMFAVT